MQILNKSEKKRILQELEKKFGIKKPSFLFLKTNKQKIRGFSGNLSKQEITTLTRIARLEIIGNYFIKNNKGIRLSLDATHLLKPSKNILNLTNKQAINWMQGKNLDLTDKQNKNLIEQIKQKNLKDFIIIKNKTNQDFLGSGKIGEKTLLNFIPKERRIK